MIEFILILIPIIYQVLMFFLTILPNEYLLFNKKLINDNIYILSNDFPKYEKNILFLGFFYIKQTNISKLSRVININDNNRIEYLINNLEQNKDLNLILDIDCKKELANLNYLTYLIKRNNIKLVTYLPNYASESSILLALSSNKLFMNWYSYLPPISNNIKNVTDTINLLYDKSYGKLYKNFNDYEFIIDRCFPKNKADKIKELFLNSIYSDIFYDHRDLKKIGLNVSTKSTENFEENYSLFLKLK